jgi:DNA-binding MarR family transcriptional regulator
MLWGSSPAAVATRFTDIAQNFVADGPAERTERARRGILAAVAHHEPATLNHVADETGRGAPAVSRSVDALVREGLIERAADPDNRRRLAMRLTQAGKDMLERPCQTRGSLIGKLERLAPSELRAVERAIEILERAK